MSVLYKGEKGKNGGAVDVIPHSRPSIDESDVSAAAEVIRSGMLTVGEERARFEREFEASVGLAPMGAVAVDSGTAALHLALMVLDVGPKDMVLLPAYMCAAPLNAVRYTRAVPLLVDVDPEPGMAGGTEFAAALNSIKGKGGKRVIIAVHPFGRSAPMDEIGSLGCPVIEDCAQAVGGSLKGKPLGSFGDISVFSFYATKVMTTGRGGMACSKSVEEANLFRDLIKYDEREDERLTFNYGMTEFQAALGRSQLKRLDAFVSRRREIAAFYRSEFAKASIPVQRPSPMNEDIHYRFIVKAGGAVERVIEELESVGISARRPVFRPLYFYTGGEELPGTKNAFEEDVSIPIYPALTDGEVERIAAAAVKVISKIKPSKIK